MAVPQAHVPNGTFVFVIDTDTYAGNFERELTAHCTGCFGDCGVGANKAQLLLEQHPEMGERFYGIVRQVADEFNCLRPTSIWPTPGFWNDGQGNQWPDSEWGSQKTINAYLKEAKKYKLEQKAPGRHPAYQSVAIFFRERPSEDMLNFIIQRIPSFKQGQPWSEPFRVLGYRLVRLNVTVTEDPLWSQTP